MGLSLDKRMHVQAFLHRHHSSQYEKLPDWEVEAIFPKSQAGFTHIFFYSLAQLTSAVQTRKHISPVVAEQKRKVRLEIESPLSMGPT
jgi:hypothetical protein